MKQARKGDRSADSSSQGASSQVDSVASDSVAIVRFEGDAERAEHDRLAVEAPLEMFVRHGAGDRRRSSPIALTMRTPGQDEELAVGYLHNEGMLSERADLLRVVADAKADRVEVELRPGLAFEPARFERAGVMNSSCGVCGKTRRELLPAAVPLAADSESDSNGGTGAWVEPALLRGLPALLRQAQRTFDQTGGLHASALFDSAGHLVVLREDVGRHNALDKLTGRVFMDGIPTERAILLLSGRASFELIQKAAMLRVPVVAAIGAPSSLALETARANNLTLVGFLKPETFNLYTGGERLRRTESETPLL